MILESGKHVVKLLNRTLRNILFELQDKILIHFSLVAEDLGFLS